MRTLVLDGSRIPGDPAEGVATAVARMLQDRSHAVELVRLREAAVAPCAGCFRCWYETPGVCVTEDDARRVTRSMAQADILALVSPVTFGGYSSVLKAVLDRSIGLVSPLFTTIGGETHHLPRYERYPALAAIGVQEDADERAAAVFSALAGRNALNLHAPAWGSEVVVRGTPGSAPSEHGGDHDGEGLARVDSLLTALERPSSATAPGGPPPGGFPSEGGVPGRTPRRALLLVGSPRPNRSTSAALGAYLARQLQIRGVAVDAWNIRSVLQSATAWRELEAAVEGADLLVLLNPLYVDSLPAPATGVLELLSVAPSLPVSGCGVVGIVNSGFPEADQSSVALAICRLFAEAVGGSWRGGLALGAGAAIDGRPLGDLGETAANVRRALDVAAEELARGEGISGEVATMMSRPLFPSWQYRERGDQTFRRLAQKHGAEVSLDRRPYVE